MIFLISSLSTVLLLPEPDLLPTVFDLLLVGTYWEGVDLGWNLGATLDGGGPEFRMFCEPDSDLTLVCRCSAFRFSSAIMSPPPPPNRPPPPPPPFGAAGFSTRGAPTTLPGPLASGGPAVFLS